MKFEIVSRDTQSTPRLILLFAGWAQSAQSVGPVSMPGYDIAVVSDYRDADAGWVGELDRYSEIVVMAWSFGVHAAARFMSAYPKLPITARIAVNGSRFTVDDSKGIPHAIFNGTLSGLSVATLRKFDMRMTGGGEAFKTYSSRIGERNIDELADELRTFDTVAAPRLHWDKAFVAKGDRIIPPVNQLAAWQDEAVEIIEVDGSHFPDFNALLRRSLTDKGFVARRFAGASDTYGTHASPQLAIGKRLLSHPSLDGVNRVSSILEIGCGAGTLTVDALRKWNPSRATLCDLHIPDALHSILADFPDVEFTFKECDAESEIIYSGVEKYDIILSASTIQWFNSLRAFLERATDSLVSGGYLVLSTFGPATMREVHHALGTVSRFMSVEAVRRAIPAGLEIIALTEEVFTIGFDTAMDVLRHISHTGVNALNSDDEESVKGARLLLKNYPLYSSGHAPLTFNPIYLILKKP